MIGRMIFKRKRWRKNDGELDLVSQLLKRQRSFVRAGLELPRQCCGDDNIHQLEAHFGRSNSASSIF